MTCSIPECERAARKRGWCELHYRRWRRTGDPLVTRKTAKADRDDCSIEGCDRPYHAKGLCSIHDRRRRYHGDPLAGGPERIIGRPTERFHSHVSRGGPDDCWPWTGSVTPNGYGQYFIDGRLIAAHRVALELATGVAVSESLDVDHICHNGDLSCPNGSDCLHRRCCNPAHLEAVTHKVNVNRGHANLGARTGPR